MIPRVYIDTSVIGGIYDPEFKEWSKKLIDEFKSGIKTVVLSDLMLREVEDAPEKVREIIINIPDASKEYVILNDEAKILARHYIEEDVVTENYLVDAQHIAIATVYRVDVVVSWNFKHIVNLKKIKLYNAVNLKHGYPIMEIRSPREVLHGEGI